MFRMFVFISIRRSARPAAVAVSSICGGTNDSGRKTGLSDGRQGTSSGRAVMVATIVTQAGKPLFSC